MDIGRRGDVSRGASSRARRTLLDFSLVSTLYFALGSIREEVRLEAAYGEDYAAYQRSGVPFYVPGP